MLTGDPPFDGKSVESLLLNIVSGNFAEKRGLGA
jgi:hypothetical protein